MAFIGAVNQTQINLDTATVELTELVVTSTSVSPQTYYCNSPADTFATILGTIAVPDAQIVMSSGLFSGDTIDISLNTGLAVVGPAVFPPQTSLAFDVTTSIDRVRMSHVGFLGSVNLRSPESGCSHCLFSDTVLLGDYMNGDITIENSQFTAGKPITVSADFGPLPSNPELLSLTVPALTAHYITHFRDFLYISAFNGGIVKANAITGAIISTDWSGTSALGNPTGLVVDDAGFLYVANNEYVYKYDTAVEGTFISYVLLDSPANSGLALDLINDKIYVGASDGRILTLDITDGGLFQIADLTVIAGMTPFGLTLDDTATNLYVSGGKVVKVLVADGTILADPFITGASITGCVFAKNNGVGQLYVADSVNSAISIYAPDTGEVITNFWKTEADGVFSPSGLTASYTHIFPCNAILDTIFKLTVSALTIDETIPVVSFYNCDFQGTSFVLNQASPSQVVFRGCRNFADFSATNATYIGINTLTDGFTIRNTITDMEIDASYKPTGYVYTAYGGPNGSDSWTSVLANPATLTLDMSNNQIINASSIESVSNLVLYTVEEGQVVLQSNATQQGEGITTSLVVSTGGIGLRSFIGPNETDYRGMSLSSDNNLTFENGTQNISNLSGTTSSKNFTLTNGEGGLLTFEDGTTQATAAVTGGQVDSVVSGTYISVDSTDPIAPIVNLALPTNTQNKNMLISTTTGDLSWTPGPISGATYYVNDGTNDLSAVLAEVGAQQGAQIIISSGSFGGDPIVVTADNLAIIGPNCVPAIVELIRAVTVSGTRIRMTHIQLDGVATLTGNSCRYSNCDFPDNVTVGSGVNTGYITLENCEFASGKTITINATGNSGAIYFINCNIGGATVTVNSASPLQVIFNNCAGFLALPLTTKATFAGLNTTAAGVINNAIQRTILASGRGTAGQVMVSGGASGNDTWSAVPSDATKYDVAGGNITGDVTLSATKSITADILNIKTLTIGSPQYITASTGVINATVTVTKCAPGLFASQALTIANGTVDGFVKVIEIINTKPIAITGANLHSSLSFTTEGQGAILVWDNDSEFWIVTALNNGAGGSGGGQVNSITAGSYIGVDSTDPVNPTVNLDLPDCDTTGKVLSSTTAGVLSWVSASGGGGFANPATVDLNMNGYAINDPKQILITDTSPGNEVALLVRVPGGGQEMMRIVQTGALFFSTYYGYVVELYPGQASVFNQGINVANNTLYQRQGTAIGGQWTPNRATKSSDSTSLPPASSSDTWNVVSFQNMESYTNSLGVQLTNGYSIDLNGQKDYKVSWCSTVYDSGYSNTRVVDFNNNIILGYGSTTHDKTTNQVNVSTGSIIFNNGTSIRLEHYTERGNANGLGNPNYSGGNTNLDCWIVIEAA